MILYEDEKVSREANLIYIHKLIVNELMNTVVNDLNNRAVTHDNTKLTEEELNGYVENGEKLRKAVIGTAEYNETLKLMEEFNKIHYSRNRHHPEHFLNGVNDMHLLDVIEMVCDWCAVSTLKNTQVEEVMQNVLFERFGIEEQLASILINTARYLNLHSNETTSGQ